MADVPFATNLLGTIDPLIANAPGAMLPGQAIGNLPDAYWAGQNQQYLQRNRNLFQNGIPPDMATALLQAGGATAVPEYIALQKLKLGQELNTPIPGEYGAPYAGIGGGMQTARAPTQPQLPPSSSGDAVSSSPTVVGDAEGVRRGLYDAPTAPGTRPPIQQEANAAPFAGRFPPISQTGGASQILPPSIGAPGVQAPAQPQQVAQAQAGPAVDQQVAEMTRQRRIADEAFKRGRAAAAIGDDALAKQFNSRAEAASNVANDINKSLLERALPTGSMKEARDPAIIQSEGLKKNAQLDAETYGKDLSTVVSAARAVPLGLQRVEEMKNLTLQPNFYSGPLSKGVLTFQQYRAAFGRDPSTAQPIEAFNKGVKDIVTEQIRSLAGAGVGRIVLAEVKNIQSAVASGDISPAGNRSQLETLRRTYLLTQGLGQVASQVAREVASGRIPAGQYRTRLSDAMDAYAQSHPVFSREEIASPTLIGAPDAPDGYTRLPKAQAQAWARQHGVQPNEPLHMPDGSYIKAP